MFRQLKNLHFYVIATVDIALFAFALFGAYTIRFDFKFGIDETSQMLRIMPFIISFKFIMFYIFGMYQGMWRYTSLKDIFNLAKTVILSSLIISAFILLYYRFEGFSRGVFVLDSLLTLVFTGGIRIFIRMIYKRNFWGRANQTASKLSSFREKKRIVLVGAGDAGEKAFREIADNPNIAYKVVAFVDDDPSKQGRSIHGTPVAGKNDELPKLVDKFDVQEIIIAIPSATGAKMRNIIDICKKTGVPFKTLPGLGELIDGKVTVKALRDVNYADLLGRKPVVLNTNIISDYLHQKTVLVTGPGGSIGSELCRQIVKYNPAQIILFDSSEPNLYAIQMELEHQVRYLKYVPVLGAVQKSDLARRVFDRYRPDVVFHAAAYKHVPMLENNPWQAVWNNVRGTQNIMSLSVEYGVDRFILVSTDKAVKPTNVMGASKRCCERMMYCYIGDKTRIMAVRFGNVVGSAGSVVPLFRRQIELGGPVTVTHPEMKRYFMTIPEASQLILQAGALGRGGELFILEMGTPVNIADMARDLIRLSGKEPGRDIEIVFDKIRPGEKLYEELLTKGEGIVPTSHEKIMVIEPNGCFDGFDGQAGYRKWLEDKFEALFVSADNYNASEIKAKLREIVPEYMIQDGEGVV